MKKFSFHLISFDSSRVFDILITVLRLLFLSFLGACFWGFVYLSIFPENFPRMIFIGGIVVFAMVFVMRLKMLFGEDIDPNGIEMKITLAGALIFAIGFFQMFL